MHCFDALNHTLIISQVANVKGGTYKRFEVHSELQHLQNESSYESQVLGESNQSVLIHSPYMTSHPAK